MPNAVKNRAPAFVHRGTYNTAVSEILDREAFLRGIAALRDLRAATLQGIAAGVEELSLPADAYLFREGDAGIRMVGHRDYVGGVWEKVGKLQLEFLVTQGLTPSHCLLDIGCGALRAGVHFIHYLAPGHYLGIDKERTLIELGLEHELGAAAREAKRPELVVSERFEFARFSRQPDFSIAQSLFTHLAPDDAVLCLRSLRDFVAPGHVCFVTFFEGDPARIPLLAG